MVGMKLKQHLDPLLMELEEAFLSKSNESFSQGEDGVLRHQVRLCVPYVNGSWLKIFHSPGCHKDVA